MNVYLDQGDRVEEGPGKRPPPFLLLDIVKVANKYEFNYSFKPKQIIKDIQALFEKAVNDIKQIPDLEPKILESLHKAKKNETQVLTPMFPKTEPETPDPTAVPK